MKRAVFALVAAVTLIGLITATSASSPSSEEAAASIAAGTLPSGYRDWRLFSVAPEEGWRSPSK
jgi:hypothetical protein